MWLMPHAALLVTAWCIKVDHVISDSSRDYPRAEVELRICYGIGLWPDERAELLFGDVIYPVCGPGFAQEHSDVTAKCLPELPLLDVEWVQPDWVGWDEVLRRARIPHGPLRGHRFSRVFVALQAAQADQGVAVGWHRLVRTSVEEGKLVRITDLELDAPGGYYLTWNDNRTPPAAEQLREWLRKISAEERNA
ncbi:LysR substrate-binding domain-containing protein [Mesorhizobium sp. M0847]|uniref:LysR substrate-binding domain-containing protein n=1 Tax=unclassified Mesorhizobium TaxID=325217 RepID=UPI00333A5917